MEDTKLLQRLLELKSTPNKAKYLDNWIQETKQGIAIQADKYLTLNASKTFAKWLKENERKGCHNYCGVLRSSRRGHYVFAVGSLAVHLKSDLGMPVLSTHKERADEILDYIEDQSTSCEVQLPLPALGDLEAEIKSWKATPKAERTCCPIYGFGKRKPEFNAEKLKEVQSIFRSGVAFYNPNREEDGCLYFKWGNYEAVLLPITKVSW